MTLADIMAARTPGPWVPQSRDDGVSAPWYIDTHAYPDGPEPVWAPPQYPVSLADARAIVTAVNLWDAHEAIRAAAAAEHESPYHRAMAPKCATCHALAAFDALAEEVEG